MENPSIIICLTGLIGSGKTTVKDMFLKYANVSEATIENVNKKKGIVIIDSINDLSEYNKVKSIPNSNLVLISVECDYEKRINRLRERDCCSGMEIHLRDKQTREKIYDVMSYKKFTVHNDRTLEETSGQVYYIHTLISPSRINMLEKDFQNQR